MFSALQSTSRIIAVLLVAAVVAGCATTRGVGNQRIADQAREKVDAIAQCAADAGVDLETAEAKPESERTPMEAAMVRASELADDIRSAEYRSNNATEDLALLLEQQSMLDRRIADVTAKLDAIDYAHDNLLAALQAFAEADSKIDQLEGRRSRETKIALLALAPTGTLAAASGGALIGLPLAIVVAEIVNAIRAAQIKAELRQHQVSVAHAIMEAAGGLRAALLNAGLAPPAEMQELLNLAEAFADSKNAEVAESLIGTGFNLLGRLRTLRAPFARDLSSLQRQLSDLTRSTQSAFERQRNAEQDLRDANNAAGDLLRQTGCQMVPLTNPDLNQSLWGNAS